MSRLPSGLKSRVSPRAREIRVMPVRARTKPAKKDQRGRGARRQSHSISAENMGAAEIMMPTVEARV